VARFGDETWRLAEHEDVRALRAAAGLLDGYDAHRARAFALAVEGDARAAVDELDVGRTDEWPFAAAHATDTARIHYLARDYERVLAALRPALRADRLDPAVAELAAAVVRHAPRLRIRAVKLVLGGGSVWQRARNAALVARG
jgi:hypothetical protein